MSEDPSDAQPPKLKLQRPSQLKQADKPKPQLTAPKAAKAEAPQASPPKLVPKPPSQQDSIKAGEIAAPAPADPPKASPPPLKAPAPKPTPPPEPELAPSQQNRPEEPAPAGVENQLQQNLKPSATPKPEAPKARNSIGTSIALIIVLMLILGGGGYAIWEMFVQPVESNDSTTPQEVSEAAEPSNPVERAKATIDTVPVADIDTITGETLATTPPVDAADDITTTAAAATPSVPQTSTGDLRPNVSSFLSSAVIGMVRTGAKARVMLNNENYRIGDEVEPTTGLIFTGTKDDKLVFKDRNEVTYHKSF